MSTQEQPIKFSPMKDVIIHKVTSPFDRPIHYYKVLVATKDGIETHAFYDLDAVYTFISEFYKETI